MVSRHGQHCCTESSFIFNIYTLAKLSIQYFCFNAPFTACEERRTAETLRSVWSRAFYRRLRMRRRVWRVSLLSLFLLRSCCSGTLRPLPPVPGASLGKGPPGVHRRRGHLWRKGYLNLHLGHSTRKTCASKRWRCVWGLPSGENHGTACPGGRGENTDRDLGAHRFWRWTRSLRNASCTRITDKGETPGYGTQVHSAPGPGGDRTRGRLLFFPENSFWGQHAAQRSGWCSQMAPGIRWLLWFAKFSQKLRHKHWF